MRKYNVKVQVNYEGDIYANSEEEAEQMAWHSYYGDDAPITYDSVEEIVVDEYDHCETCDHPEDECECCEECGKLYEDCECEDA
jgi:hypothetical protein